MKIETYLNAMIGAYYRAEKDWTVGPGLLSPQYKKHQRQYYAFRDRIIRHDERQKMRIAGLEGQLELEQAEVKRLGERMGVYRT